MHETAERVYNLLYGQRNPLWLLEGIYKAALCDHIISVSELTDRDIAVDVLLRDQRFKPCLT